MDPQPPAPPCARCTRLVEDCEKEVKGGSNLVGEAREAVCGSGIEQGCIQNRQPRSSLLLGGGGT